MLIDILNRILERLVIWLNESRIGKSAQHFFLRHISYRWIRRVMSKQMVCEGTHFLADFDPEQGTIFVCNHRSYFDFYAVSTLLFGPRSPWVHRLVFPVRAGYFYDRPMGFLINLFVAAGAMYPPVYDSSHKNGKRTDLRYLESSLGKRGWVVGMHPEGMMNRNSDPYKLLPFQHGAAHLILKTNAPVVPVFINGLDNGFGNMISRYLKNLGKADPCICVFGEPFYCGDRDINSDGQNTKEKISKRLHQEILFLGEREKQLRKELSKGQIDDKDERWLCNI